MDVEYGAPLQGENRRRWRAFLQQAGLTADEGVDFTLLLTEDGKIAATGSLEGNILKCIAVDPAYQEEGLTATLVTRLRQEAFENGVEHLFLYTKPQNRIIFEQLFFYPVAQTRQVLLMENRPHGIREFVSSLPRCPGGTVGATVMNCNPFTLGHRYLIETAAKDCDWVYVFVLSEDKSFFPAADRLELVRQGTADLPNVIVATTGPYLISSATFPAYFLQQDAPLQEIHCQLDIEIFVGYFAPALGIARRYVGTEPLSPVTAQYNQALKAFLPGKGIQVVELPRREQNGAPVSASMVRSLLHRGQGDILKDLVPSSTYAYLEQQNLI